MSLTKPTLTILLVLSSFCNLQAQTFTIKGRVSDTLNNNQLQYATVTLMRAADSILETFTRSKENGTFELHPRNAGKYIVMVTFPSFADYVDVVTVSKEKPVKDMGMIPMITKSHLLSEFVLKQQIGAIKIKGDTVEYMADSFAVRDNATVEELLKKLPGIQVNKNGEVVAQGETVQKILVDGEEFFTDDPAVVTKSLQAKAVESVQVFDKKSDQTEFTGIDDGTREKTINLKLKDNMKKGYFGRINAGGGTDGYFENQAMINAFKNKRQISAFGIIANTGKIGLGWQDRDKFGGSGGNIIDMNDNGGMTIMVTNNGDDNFESWNGTYNGQGIPTAWTGGLHYANKWDDNKLHLSSNYRFAKQNIETTGNTLTQYNLPEGSSVSQYYTSENKKAFSTGERHRVDGLFEWKIDTSSSLKLTANANYSDTKSNTNYSSESYTTANDTVKNLLNSNERISTSDANSKGVNASLAYRKKFAKKGRTISVTLDEGYKTTQSTGTLISNTHLFTPATDTTAADTVLNTIDQKKENDATNFQLAGNVAYTEPLSKVLFLELNYGLTVNNSHSKLLSLNPSVPVGASDYVDSVYSSDYNFNYLVNKGGVNLRYVYKKINFALGGNISSTHFNQTDNFTADKKVYTRNYMNYAPSASFVYRPSQQQSFSINYNGSTQQPKISQIQPLKQNTDPLNISIGNPNLKQEFDNSIYVRYNNYKIFSGTYTYLGGGVTFVNDDISRSETIAGGVNTYQYINVNGNYNGWGYGGYGWNIRKLDLRLGFNGNINIGRTNTIVNGQKNASNNNVFRFGLDVNYDKDKKFNIHYNPSASFNNNTSSVNGTNTNYWSYENQLEGNVQLPLKFELGTDIVWTIRQRVGQFDKNNSVFVWNAYISKKLLKGDQLEIRASCNDILNQNIGFQRFGYNGNVTQQNYNTIQRYGMLSIIWNFSKSAAGLTPQNDAPQLKIKL